MRSIAVVDYGAGNLRSVENALRHLHADFFVTAHPEDLGLAEGLVFPGVGEARAAMDALHRTGLGEGIKSFLASGRMALGICIGCQIILQGSEERDTPCLGVVEGVARLFPATPGLKVPHMGWNQVDYRPEEPIFRGIPEGSSFFFVHSYYPSPERETDIAAWTDYGIRFASAIRRENLCAVQFHPEKSGPLGLRLLANFLESVQGRGHA
jgi:imidazole glycerol-phosphate synthase subunit HisH